MERAAAYIRVSTDEQTEYSPAAQLYAIRRFAEQSGLNLSDEHVYRDEGVSGRRADKRPEFMRMIAAAKRKPKPFDVILIHKFDRFARSREDSIVYKSLLRRDCHIKVVSVTERLEDDRFSVILESMLEAMAEYYSLNLSDEVKKGMEEKARRGELQTPAPFGYAMEDGLLTPIAAEAELVRQIFIKYTDGDTGTREIARQMNLSGARTKRGNAFDKRLVEYIIKNPVYTGKIRWGGILTDGKHAAIVEPRLWERANNKLAVRSKTRSRYEAGAPLSTHWLRGLLRCAECGGVLAFGKAYGTRESAYRCNKYINGGCGKSQRITVSKIEEAVLAAISGDGRAGDTRYVLGNWPPPGMADSECESITRLLEKNASKLAKAAELALLGIDSPEEYRANKQRLADENTRLCQALEYAQKATGKLTAASCDEIGGIADILCAKDATLAQKNAAISEIVNKIVVDKENSELRLYYYFLKG